MEEVLYKKTGHTAIIIFNRPGKLNALCETFMKKINAVLDQVERDPEVYVLILTGRGKAFIAGADIGEMYEKDSDTIFEWSSMGSDQNLRIEQMKIPVIAAINGYALGGGLEMAMACDIRLASEKARLGMTETKLGLISAAGGSQRLPKLVGYSMAAEMIFTGKMIDAHEALRIGLVNHVFGEKELMDKALSMAEDIGKRGQMAVRAAKRAMKFADGDMETNCLREREEFRQLFKTEDQKIGMKGFLEKKDITFKNK